MICQCPAGASIPTLGTPACPENFGQIQKIAFQRLEDGEGGLNGFSSSGILTKAAWDTAIAAVDSTKVAVSPFVEAPTQEGGDPRTFGGGNDTLGGIEIVIGSNPTTFSCVIRRCPQNVIAKMKELMCEAAAGNLGVYLFSENGQIEAIEHDLTTQAAKDAYVPIPIRSLFVGDKIHGGFDEPDSNTLQFSFEPNYSDKLAIVTPNFNPLTL